MKPEFVRSDFDATFVEYGANNSNAEASVLANGNCTFQCCDAARKECNQCSILTQQLEQQRASMAANIGFLLLERDEARAECQSIKEKYDQLVAFKSNRPFSGFSARNFGVQELFLKTSRQELQLNVYRATIRNLESERDKLQTRLAEKRAPKPSSDKTTSPEKQKTVTFADLTREDLDNDLMKVEMLQKLEEVPLEECDNNLKPFSKLSTIPESDDSVVAEHLGRSGCSFATDVLAESVVQNTFCLLCGSVHQVDELKRHILQRHLAPSDLEICTSGLVDDTVRSAYVELLSLVIAAHSCELTKAAGNVSGILAQLKECCLSCSPTDKFLNGSIMDVSVLSPMDNCLPPAFMQFCTTTKISLPLPLDTKDTVQKAYQKWFKQVDMESLAKNISLSLHLLDSSITQFAVMINKYDGASITVSAPCSVAKQCCFLLNSVKGCIFEAPIGNASVDLLPEVQKLDEIIFSFQELSLEGGHRHIAIANTVKNLLRERSTCHWSVVCGKSKQAVVYFPPGAKCCTSFAAHGTVVYLWCCNCAVKL